VVVVVVMGDMGARRTKTFLWVLLLLHQAFNLVVFFFTWFAAVGVGPNSGPLDPDVIKWLLLPGLIFCFVLFLVALLAGTFRDNTKWRQNAHTWFYAEAVFFLGSPVRRIKSFVVIDSPISKLSHTSLYVFISCLLSWKISRYNNNGDRSLLFPYCILHLLACPIIS